MADTPRSVMTQDPRAYFGYDACRSCRSAPCTELMHKGHTSYGSRFVVVHRQGYDTRTPCPFASEDWNEIERTFFSSLPPRDLARLASRLIAGLSVSEMLQHPPEAAGTIGWLQRLWRNRTIAAIRVPYNPDDKTKQWLDAWHRAIFVRPKRVEKVVVAGEGAEVVEGAGDMAFSEVRWELADEKVKKETPDIAKPGDMLTLSAVVKKPLPDLKADFELWYHNDTANEKFAVVAGTLTDDILKAQWKADFSKVPEKTFEVRFRPIAKKIIGDFAPIALQPVLKGAFRARFLDENKKGISGISCVVILDNKEVWKGALDDGSFTIEEVPAALLEARVTFKAVSYNFFVPWNSRTNEFTDIFIPSETLAPGK